jgi:hypothetical protein
MSCTGKVGVMEESERAGEAVISRQRLGKLISLEREQYAASHAASLRAFERGGEHLLGGVPMTWMRMWPGDSRSAWRRRTGQG